MVIEEMVNEEMKTTGTETIREAGAVTTMVTDETTNGATTTEITNMVEVRTTMMTEEIIGGRDDVMIEEGKAIDETVEEVDGGR